MRNPSPDHTRPSLTLNRILHGNRFKRYTFEEAFWSRVNVRDEDECWTWRGAPNAGGYGRFFRDGERRLAHRVSLEIKLGRPLSTYEDACHACDNPICVNPKHLWVGDDSANQRDAVAKGRQHQSRKTHCPQGHAYTPENVIRKRHDPSRRRCRQCHNEYQRARRRRRASQCAI